MMTLLFFHIIIIATVCTQSFWAEHIKRMITIRTWMLMTENLFMKAVAN